MPKEPAQPDIMQMARIGDIAGMEKLFESGEYDATYADEEGITPLHVRPTLYIFFPHSFVTKFPVRSWLTNVRYSFV